MSIASFSRVLAGQDLSFTQKLTSFVGVLDDFSTSTTHGYSLRKLRTAYTGNAVRVRRSLDNAEQDIGFTSSGDLDQTALTAFVGSENIVRSSEDLTGTGWSGFNVTRAAGTNIAPDGTATAGTINFTSVQGIAVARVTGLTPSTQYTFSAYMKVSSGSFELKISTTDTTTWATATVSSALSIGTSWVRYELTFTTLGAQVQADLIIGDESKTGYNLPATGIIQAWGAQLNTGSSASVYTKTTGTANYANGFITTWYDQMGSNNASQVTAADQPRLVAAGAVKTYNSKPGVEWHNSGSTNTGLFTSSAINNSVQAHTVSLLRTGYAANARLITGVSVLSDLWALGGYTTGSVNGGSIIALNGTSVLPADTLRAVDVFGISSGVAYIGNVASFPRSWYGGISEVVFFRTATTEPQRLIIDANIMSYYGIS